MAGGLLQKCVALQNLEGTVRHIDFRDTFLDAAHVPEAFPDHTVKFVDADGAEVSGDARPPPPYRVTFPPFNAEHASEPLPGGVAEPPAGTLVVRSYTPTVATPFPQLQPGQNGVRFNREQLQVILSGLQPGLTMCVGPPGTGKTDTAVQVRPDTSLSLTVENVGVLVCMPLAALHTALLAWFVSFVIRGCL